uniref:Uncharacterized protein n=1 Tax=Bionectria ochroleuca TaxID=29856 RepID=A0A0B7KG89_BIOOC
MAKSSRIKGARNGQASLFSAGHFNFLTLLFTTPVSFFLLYASVQSIRFPGGFFDFISNNRPSVQFAVQLIANFLSAAQVIVLCRLINFAIRRRFASREMDLNTMLMWSDAMVTHMDWDLPPKFLLPLLLFLGSTKAFRGIWAASLTPVITWKETHGQVAIPSWDDVSLLREYASEIGNGGLMIQNTHGRFSYSVALDFLGSLLASASSATPIEPGSRQQRKIDNSRYTYMGRSYGMGSTAGLVDDNIEGNPHARLYTYQEDGYRADVDCIYNETSDFRLEESTQHWVYTARGMLPDSDDTEEYSSYNASDPELPPRRYLAFATGKSYTFLDKVQCSIDFHPTKFNVTVNIEGRNITVNPADILGVGDIDPTRRLKGTLLRQFELIANDETNLYVSMVGSAFNASITDLKTSIAAGNSPQKSNESDIVLEGVRNSITAMADDMLGAYAAAQVMIGNFSQTTPTTIRVSAIAIGEFKYAISVFILNVVVIGLFIAEVIRTSWWSGMPEFDMTDLRSERESTVEEYELERTPIMERCEERSSVGERHKCAPTVVQTWI